MEQREEMDLQRCDEVWRRVAPDLNPYPEVRAAVGAETSGDASQTTRQGEEILTPEALAAAAEEALDASRAYLSHARCVGGATGRSLMTLASDSVRHAAKMRSLYYLLTGEYCRPCPVSGRPEILGLCQFLRQRYRMAVEAASQWDSWADGADDECMASVLRSMARDKRCHAAELMSLLERRLG